MTDQHGDDSKQEDLRQVKKSFPIPGDCTKNQLKNNYYLNYCTSENDDYDNCLNSFEVSQHNDDDIDKPSYMISFNRIQMSLIELTK
ncbi:putative NADH oxidase [Dirofilaria immitis]